MSNRLVIQFCRFIDLDNNLVADEKDKKNYGFRIFDDYDGDYCVFGPKEELAKHLDADPKRFAISVIRMARNNVTERVGALLDYVEENQTGIYINDHYYSWEEIKEAFEEDENA